MGNINSLHADFTIGRGVLVIPNYEFSGATHPKEAVEFIDNIWAQIGVAGEGGDRNIQLMVAASDSMPSIVMNYFKKLPKKASDSPVTEYMLSAKLDEADELRPVFCATHTQRPNQGSDALRDGLYVGSELGSVESSICESGGYYRYSPEQLQGQRLLTRIMNDLVETYFVKL